MDGTLIEGNRLISRRHVSKTFFGMLSSTTLHASKSTSIKILLLALDKSDRG